MLTTNTPFRQGFKVILATLCISLLSGCSVNMMSSYDKKTDARLEKFSIAANTLLYELEEIDAKKPDCQYENHAEAYRGLKVQLQTMDMHEQAKPKNKPTQQQIKALQERLELLITDHKRICQPAVVVNIVQKDINSMLGHILQLERSKNGATQH